MDWTTLNKLSKQVKAMYPKGTVVESIFVDDIKAPPKGTRGVVTHVDDIGTVFVNWDDEKYVSGVLVLEKDRIRIIK